MELDNKVFIKIKGTCGNIIRIKYFIELPGISL